MLAFSKKKKKVSKRIPQRLCASLLFFLLHATSLYDSTKEVGVRISNFLGNIIVFVCKRGCKNAAKSSDIQTLSKCTVHGLILSLQLNYFEKIDRQKIEKKHKPKIIALMRSRAMIHTCRMGKGSRESDRVNYSAVLFMKTCLLSLILEQQELTHRR